MRPAYRRRAARRRRWLRRLACAAAVLAIVLGLRLALRAGGLIVRPLREMPCDAVFFYQEDEWAQDTLGASDRTLGKDGDSVCCLASVMRMQRLPAPFEETLNPGTLNAWLSENGGYADDGSLRWSRAAELLGLQLVEKPAQGKLAVLLDALLQREIYPIVRVKRPDTGKMHEVVLTGSVHGEFTIADPLDPTGTLNSLALYGNRIYGARYLEQKQGE